MKIESGDKSTLTIMESFRNIILHYSKAMEKSQNDGIKRLQNILE
jgi:hypothetical protein